MPIGYDYIPLLAVSRQEGCHIGVGFLLFIDCMGMRRPLIASKQLEACAFSCIYSNKTNKITTHITHNLKTEGAMGYNSRSQV